LWTRSLLLGPRASSRILRCEVRWLDVHTVCNRNKPTKLTRPPPSRKVERDPASVVPACTSAGPRRVLPTCVLPTCLPSVPICALADFRPLSPLARPFPACSFSKCPALSYRPAFLACCDLHFLSLPASSPLPSYRPLPDSRCPFVLDSCLFSLPPPRLLCPFPSSSITRFLPCLLVALLPLLARPHA
jgi:hypothetical protein